MSTAQKLPTIGLLSITDGRLMGDIGTVYEVLSHFVGRPVFTHEIPKYGRLARPIILKDFEQLDTTDCPDWQAARDWAVAHFGEEMEVPAGWAGVLADGKSPIENLNNIVDGKD
ncbi:DUF7736 domain-containing protein [Pararhizobium haloflavum]|uniref:DUF7736 domain-containing protein n=1 Tax=Pararhizobium haloflavum TaxID=2037914 RepID=UPI000C199908|nr:hypothetical protein [Pararhizobium haloflavum]